MVKCDDGQKSLDEDDSVQSSVRMTVNEREAVVSKFGGIQAGWDNLVKMAQEEKGWIPDLPRRLIPAFRAIRDIALERRGQIVDSHKLREVVMNGCNCTRRTAVAHLHEIKDRGLILTRGVWGDEMFHFVACNSEDLERIRKNVDLDVVGYGKK